MYIYEYIYMHIYTYILILLCHGINYNEGRLRDINYCSQNCVVTHIGYVYLITCNCHNLNVAKFYNYWE